MDELYPSVAFLTAVSIWGSAVLAEGGQTAGSSRALICKQAGMIRGVQKWLKKGIQRVWRSAQWALWPIGTGGTETGRWAVGWGRSTAGRCEWCHSRGYAVVENRLPLSVWPSFRKEEVFSDLISVPPQNKYWPNTVKEMGHQKLLESHSISRGLCCGFL